MKNVLILGSGRSGTSLLTGLLAQSGYHLGNNHEYLKKNNANPKGYFEDYEINTLNEDILKLNLINYPESIRKRFFPSATFYRARWLERFSLNKNIKFNNHLKGRVRKLIERQGFCYKDPRFSYTLPVWNKVFFECKVDVKYLVVYREPYKTTRSIMRECEENTVLHKLKMTEKIALEVWEKMYGHILKNYDQHNKKKDWMFIHFQQLFEEWKILEIEKFLGVLVDKDFPEKKMSRTKNTEGEIKGKLKRTYNRLNSLSRFEGN